MERTIPSTASEEIELFQRTYYSLLRTTSEVQIRSLVESHTHVESALHAKAADPELDVDALVYTSLRLPSCIVKVRLVIMSPSERTFEEQGEFTNIKSWQSVATPGRRRRALYDGNETLATFIASRADIDDLIPMLTAYQIEWNKIHDKLHYGPVLKQLQACSDGDREFDQELRAQIHQALQLSPEDFDRIEAVWREQTADTWLAMARHRKRLAVRLISGAYVDYRRAAREWWLNISHNILTPLDQRPVYFVSSNPHSLVNLLIGCPLRREEELIRFVEGGDDPSLLAEYRSILQEEVPSSRENFLYYVAKKLHGASQGQPSLEVCRAEMRSCGVTRVESKHHVDVEAQVIELCALRPEWLDPRVHVDGMELLGDSDAVILNIDYPLGLAAYRILTEVFTGVGALRGLYVQGKAATLNGRVGDVMIPSVVHDEDSQNTFLFKNAFDAADVSKYLVYGTVLDNQKSISVRGTFLQNREYMNIFYREGFTDIEMEAGPYLSAVYEAIESERYPVNEIINLYPAPFEIGILHYASDTPFTRGKTLGRHLSYYGMDPTYACSIAIVRRILETEIAAVRNRVRALSDRK